MSPANAMLLDLDEATTTRSAIGGGRSVRTRPGQNVTDASMGLPTDFEAIFDQISASVQRMTFDARNLRERFERVLAKIDQLPR